MAIPLFVWVFEAYLCPANAIFPQLELIQTLSKEFERGAAYVSYTVLSRRRRDTVTYLQLGGALFRPPSPCHSRRMAPSRLELLRVKKASSRKMSRPSASACSLWSERAICSCSSTMPGAFVLEKTHPLYKMKKLLALLVTFGCNNVLH